MLCETSNDSMLQRVRVVHVVRVSVRVACAGARVPVCCLCEVWCPCGLRAAGVPKSLCRLCFMWERRRTARAFHVHADHAFGVRP
jgi:hypothetical protein